MSLCKYYLRGNCRFGNSCWNIHSNPERTSSRYEQNPDYSNKWSQVGRYKSENRHYNENHYQTNYEEGKPYDNRYHALGQDGNYSSRFSSPVHNRRNEQTQNLSKHELIAQVKEDMNVWTEGDQWELSCYGPRPELNLPPFTDVSPEELRWGISQAEHSNTLVPFMAQVEKAQRQVALARQELGKHSTLITSALDQSKSGIKTIPLEIQNLLSSIYGNESSLCTSVNSYLDKQKPFSFLDSGPEPNGFNMTGLLNSPSDGKFLFGSLSSATQALSSSQSPFDSKQAEMSSTSQNALNSSDVQPHFGNASNYSSFSKNLATNTSSLNFSFLSSVSKNDNGIQCREKTDTPAFSKGLNQKAENPEIYSQLQELDPDTINHLEAKTFILGKIPLAPPPRELCF